MPGTRTYFGPNTADWQTCRPRSPATPALHPHHYSHSRSDIYIDLHSRTDTGHLSDLRPAFGLHHACHPDHLTDH